MTRTTALATTAAFLISAGVMIGLGPPPRAASSPAQAKTFRERVGSLNEFSRQLDADAFVLSYGFIDYEGAEHRIRCRLSRDAHRRLSGRFGYDWDQIVASADAEIRTIAARILRERRVDSHVELEVSGGRVRASYSAPRAVFEHVRDTVEDLLNDTLPRERRRLEEALLREAGFRLEGDTIQIDYRQLAIDATPVLDDCFQALRAAGRGYDVQQYLGQFIAFLQEARYEIPPDSAGGRQIGGLWVPTEVLTNHHGDCDSKSVTFAALWRRWADSRVLIIRVPGHALVGVAVHHPLPGQSHVRIGNRYFVLCEVAGPGKLYPGRQTSVTDGNYRYTEVANVGAP